MKINKISVFSNFCIDTNERLSRMKDSFNSFKKANISDWCLNIRGQLKNEAKYFFEKNIEQEFKIFHHESNEGWAQDTEKILPLLKSKLIFVWIEDHICIKNFIEINQIIEEMYENNIDYLKYTFFSNKADFPKIKYVKYKDNKKTYSFNLNDENYEKIKIGYKNDKIKPNYLISMPCIMSVDLFKKNLSITKKKEKYEAHLPFNFEKTFLETEIMPFENSLLKEELFVPIDDDKDIPNSSLIGRGLYKERTKRSELNEFRDQTHGYYKKINFFKKIINFIKKQIKF